MPPDGGTEFNRLIFEQSPYLLQHARNPVDWFPWSEAAFEKARIEDKPIFLSIGYSTCHWCHVMEHESFEDDAVAELLNTHFVCIKVDREERPDIDQIYMAVTQALTGHGGWPMTVILTPDKKPFFAGTYFSKHSKYGRSGMMELLPALSKAWKERRDDVVSSADQITQLLRNMPSETSDENLDESVFDTAFDQFSQQFDTHHGGFGNAPKFPTPHNLSFLLRYWRRSEKSEALTMVEKTLKAMRHGGMYDHIGFGFHRYSTDAKWLVPHFEKMLYDQAMLAIAYVEAYQATRNDFYKKTAEEIFTYVLRDLRYPEGGFYSAEDADSEGVEGKFYVWTRDELKQILDDNELKLAEEIFNVTSDGNYHDEASHEQTGTNILHITKDLDVLAFQSGCSENEFNTKLESVRRKLFDVRERRVHPFKDDKILTDWNGLMIAAFAKGAAVFDNPDYAAMAKNAADFILHNMRDQNGRLFKRWRQGEAGLPACADDYAMMIWGLIEIYEATFEEKYLRSAVELNTMFLEHFWDEENGGLYFTPDDGETLITRLKEIYDGAVPSGNSVAALNLIRLSRLTGDLSLAEKSSHIGRAFARNIGHVPMAHAQFLIAHDFLPSKEIVIVGDPDAEDTQKMIRALNELFLPNKVVLLRKTNSDELFAITPFTKSYTMINSKATVYVCEDFACKTPTNEVKKMIELLK
ncbi:thioredoxin domain-containing protein [bacterium]|nr:thioredoxin domain-containing protein [bacterium]